MSANRGIKACVRTVKTAAARNTCATSFGNAPDALRVAPSWMGRVPLEAPPPDWRVGGSSVNETARCDERSTGMAGTGGGSGAE